MSEKDSKQSRSKAESTDDVGQAEVQDAFDEANEQGFFGTTSDPTPNENYTVAGVIGCAPTPETDEDARAAVQKHQAADLKASE